MDVRRFHSCLVFISCLVLTACGGGGDSSNPAPPAPPQSQTIAFAQAGPVSSAVGSSVTNVASGGAGTGAVSYASSNTAIATVNATSGAVSLLTAGSTTVTATKAASTGFNAATADYTLNVTPGAQSIAFAQAGPLNVLLLSTTNNLASGGSGAGAVTYTSSNTNAVTVDQTSGAATAVGVGTAVITGAKAADANYTQAQATYIVNVQTTGKASAWIGSQGAEVSLPASANGKQFGRTRAGDCTQAGTVVTCSLAELNTVNGASINDTRATLANPAYYAIVDGANIGTPILASNNRFSERIGHSVTYFKNRYWVVGGGHPAIPGTLPQQYTTLSDVWSSADGKTWRRETADGGFGARWFHHVVVFNDRLWLISGAQFPVPAAPALPFLTDVWSSSDGVTWTRETTDAQLPWWSTDLNVVVFNNELLAVSGGRTFSSTTGVFAAKSPVNVAALTGTTQGRTDASLTIYDGLLWYIGGKLDFPINSPPGGDANNDAWNSSDGIAWTQVTAHAAFTPRYRHAAFVANGRLWVFGGQAATAGVAGAPSADAWSTTDGVTWTQENASALARSYLAKVVQETAPARVTLIGGIQGGFANNVWQTANGADWSELSAHAQFSSRHTVGVDFKGQVWIIGGSALDGSAGGSDVNEIWRSSDGLNWSRVATNGTLFSPRNGHSAIVFNNQLWVIGGWDNVIGSGGTETRLDDVWSSADGVTWTAHAPAAGNIFSPRLGHAAAVFAGKLWVVGGSAAGGDVNDVWSTIDGTTWVRETTGAAFGARSAHRVVTFNNAMWLIAGGSITGLDDIWRSTDGITWTQMQPVGPHFAARTWHSAEVMNGRIYVAGGVADTAYVTSIRYNDVWSTADGVSWRQDTAAAAFMPRGLHATVAHNDQLYLIGGFGLGLSNEVWRSSDGADWHVGFSSDIAPP